MKYYCIDYQNCGFFTTNPADIYSEEDPLAPPICPHCYSYILTYQTYEYPHWEKQPYVEED